MDDSAGLRRGVFLAAKSVHRMGLVDYGEGNVSGRVPAKKEMVITPTLNDYERLNPSDLVRVGFDGTVVGESKRSPSSEYRLHAFLYEARPNASYVVHTHSPYASALSVARKPLPAIFEEMAIFIGGDVRVADYAIANTREVGKSALKALRGRNACLLANHGVVAVGRTAPDAVKAASLVEKMARVYIGSQALGGAKAIHESSLKSFRRRFDELFSTV